MYKLKYVASVYITKLGNIITYNNLIYLNYMYT